MIIGVESFRQINSGENSATRSMAVFPLIKVLGNSRGEGKEGGYARATGGEAVLGGRAGVREVGAS